MSEYIPDHILANVLAKLPFKSLNRFRCVSKSWRELIDSKYITGMHSSTRSRLCQPNPHPDSMILELVDHKRLYAFDSVAKKGKDAYEAIPKQLSVDLPENPGFWVVGSCNGVLCLNLDVWQENTSHMVLWNPFTRTYIELPPLPDDFQSRHPTMTEAFGYDHVNDDYKVMKWYRNAAPNFNANEQIGCRRYDRCVYSLKHNSWSTIRDGIPFEIPEDDFLDYRCTITNGAAHWLLKQYWTDDNSENFIAAFDLATYEFRKISCGLSTVDRGRMILSCLNGSLSLVCYPERRRRIGRRGITENGVADIWVMEEYGVETSWNKLTSIQFPWEVSNVIPVVFIEKRGKLLLELDDQKLAFYDVNRKSFSKVSMKGERECTGRCFCEDKLDCCRYWSKNYCVCVGTFATPFLLE